MACYVSYGSVAGHYSPNLTHCHFRDIVQGTSLHLSIGMLLRRLLLLRYEFRGLYSHNEEYMFLCLVSTHFYMFIE